MESSTSTPMDNDRAHSKRTSKSRGRHTSQSESHNIAKPLPKTPPASPPTQVQSSILPLEGVPGLISPSITSPSAARHAPSSSHTTKDTTSASGHGSSRSTSILKVDMVKPGSNWDARRAHGGSRATPVKARGTSSENNHQRGGSSSVQHSRAPSSDAEGRRTGAATTRPSQERQRSRPSLDTSGAPISPNGSVSTPREATSTKGTAVAVPTSSRRGPSLEIRHGGGSSTGGHHPKTPSDAENRRMVSGQPRIRVPSNEHPAGRPGQESSEATRPIIFDVETKLAGNRPVRKRGPSADPEFRRPRTSSQDRTPEASTPISPRARRPSFEANIRRPGAVGAELANVRPDVRRPGISASDSGHANPRTNEPRAGTRGRTGISASDTGHADPQGSRARRDSEDDPIRFNSTPAKPPINYRGYTPVPVTNADDEEHAHGHETSTRLSHEKTLEDAPAFMQVRPFPGGKDADDPEKRKFNEDIRRRHLRVLLISLAIILLLIMAIVLLVKFVRPRILGAIDSMGQGADNSTLSQDQIQCLSDFRANATADPPSYVCSSCLPRLQAVSPQFLQNGSNTDDINDINAARQFCGLQAIYNATTLNQAGLSSAGWLKNTQTCTWGGVGCDSSGALTALNLTFPAVPQKLPAEMSALTSLTNLMITGDRSVPAGSLNPGLPSSLRSLQLYNTHLEGLSNADGSWFEEDGGLSGLTELILDGNPSLGTSLPRGLFNVPLQTLVVRNQQLNMQLDELGNGGGLASVLTTLDLSLNNLTGTLGLLYLPRLTKLDLSNNNLLLIPTIFTWPSTLQTVHFQNNPNLNGTLSNSSLCSNPSINDCNFQGTDFSGRNLTCGRCLF
ncbi:hypothetical protein M408DRAFT_21371 [Serendipita vermifera MAFF 305830]|uniref:Leucine-rich repeat-containing N-terminal plant-type domain-containing protein n=1 Tax=Serendipita vermifera MAFF 305830 TaxID=933852 RepID=A0A0C2XQS9_SERVB|nr:hypothetical protein M408DRAFT_21371 [Serendipita vermifera MAFF 305830]